MAKRRIIIELSSSTLRVTVAHHPPRTCSRHHDSQGWAEDWPAALAALDPGLAAVVGELGIAGEAATVVYDSPESAAAVFSCPAAAGSRRALQAARLALAEAVAFSLDVGSHTLTPLATDRAAGEGTEPPCRHTLAAADTDSNLRTLVEWLARAGLRPAALIPAPAALLAGAVLQALEVSSAGAPVTTVHIGRHSCALAGVVDGRLRFVRHIPLGVETLVAAIARQSAAKTPDADASAVLLGRVGIPRTGDPADAESGIIPESLLPAMQPVLQRLIVELKQSLRFGMGAGERTAARLCLAGPGSDVPRLAAVLAEQTGTLAQDMPKESADALWPPPEMPVPVLVPRAAAQASSRGSMTRTVWLGVASLALFLASDAILTRVDLGIQRGRAESLVVRLNGAGQTSGAEPTLAAAQAGLARARSHITAKLGAAAPLDAALAMLAGTTPAEIRLTEITLSGDLGRPTVRIRGYTPVATRADATGRIKKYLDAIAQVPLVAECALGATQRTREGTAVSQEFEMTIALVGLPADLGLSAAAGEGAP